MLSTDDNLFLHLAEECAEVSQRVSKILRFGLEEVQGGQPLSNKERLSLEVIDLLAVLKLLDENGLVNVYGRSDYQDIVQNKLQKIRFYQSYSKQMGKLQ